MKKSFKFKHRRESDEVALQITSMADIFTILLVFLLKSYASGAVQIQPSADVKLPDAGVESTHLEALKVEISATGIQIESKPVLPLSSYRFQSQDMDSNGTSKGLVKLLEKERKRQLLIAKSNDDVKVDARIVLIADRKTPYSTLKTVLASAAVQGYTDFKLAVINRNQ